MRVRAESLLPTELRARIPTPSSLSPAVAGAQLEVAWAKLEPLFVEYLEDFAVGRPAKPRGSAPFTEKTRWADACSVFDQKAAAVSELAPVLWAISAALRQLDDAGLQAELISEGWWLSQETLVHAAWIKYHQDLLAGGKTVAFPFTGQVGPRNSRSRHRDREFFALLLLGNWLRASRGDELKIVRVGQTPDFVCSLGGVEWGVEMTEAVPEKRAAKQTIADRVGDRLERLAIDLGVQLHIQSESSIAELERAWAAHDATIRSQAASSASDVVAELTEGPNTFTVEIERGKRPLVLYSDRDGIDDSELNRSKREAIECLESIVRMKLSGAVPALRPCLLAIYPNFLNHADLRSTLEEAAAAWAIAVDSHFDEVWVVQEQVAQKLV